MRFQLVTAALIAAAMAACTGPAGQAGAKGDQGDKGDPGQNGQNGTNGQDGQPGQDGQDGQDGQNGQDGVDGVNGNNVVLSERARIGYDIDEAGLDPELLANNGLSGDQIESIGRGAYLMNAVADCKGCHNGVGPMGETLYLAGNGDFPLGPVTVGGNTVDGHVFGRNLTPDAITGMKLNEKQFVEALRTGKDFQDSAVDQQLLVMPWQNTRWLSDGDLQDIFRYLKQIPAVSNAVQDDVKPVIPVAAGPFGDKGQQDKVVSFGDGDVARDLPSALDPTQTPPAPTSAAAEAFDDGNVLRGLAISPLDDGATVAGLSPGDQALYGRGSYLVNGPGLCNECHTAGGRNLDGTVATNIFLEGGQAFAVPPPLQPVIGQVRTMSADLIGADNGFDGTLADFMTTMVSGVSLRNDPHPMGFPMPFQTLRNMTVDDKAAVYMYVHTLQGGGALSGESQTQSPARFCDTANGDADCDAGETCTAIQVNGADTAECTGKTCATDADCGACQACADPGSTGTTTCQPEDPASACVTGSF